MVIVKFTDKHDRGLGQRVMDAVPRSGEAVCLDGETTLTVWNVGWQLYGGEQVAWVSLRTRQQYKMDLSRSIRRETPT